MLHRLIVAGLVVTLSAGTALGEEWPGWRGPRGDGTSREKGVPLKWGTKENVRWKVEVPGIGHSSPVVYGDRVFVTTCVEGAGKGERMLLCYDRRGGKERWRRVVLSAKLERKHALNSYASGTPATDGKHVYVAFLDYPNMEVACYDVDGTRVWQRSPGKLLSVHGFCTSPVLHRGLVILNGDQDGDGYLVALDKRTGAQRWRVDRPNKTRSYCTPLLIPDPRRPGATQLVLSGSKCVAGYDADSGKPRWIVDGPTEQYVASLVYHKGVLFLTTGFPEHHLMGINPAGEGNITKSKYVLWHVDNRANGPGGRGASYIPSPAAHGGYFFVVSDPGYLSCLEASTGKRLWMHKLGRRHSASIVRVEDRLLLPDDDGVTWVVKAGPKFELVHKNELGEPCFASPAVAHGEVFLRTEKHLWCVGR